MRVRTGVLAVVIAAFGLVGASVPAQASCGTVVQCVDAVVCLVGSKAGLQCVD